MQVLSMKIKNIHDQLHVWENLGQPSETVDLSRSYAYHHVYATIAPFLLSQNTHDILKSSLFSFFKTFLKIFVISSASLPTQPQISVEHVTCSDDLLLTLGLGNDHISPWFIGHPALSTQYTYIVWRTLLSDHTVSHSMSTPTTSYLWNSDLSSERGTFTSRLKPRKI